MKVELTEIHFPFKQTSKVWAQSVKVPSCLDAKQHSTLRRHEQDCQARTDVRPMTARILVAPFLGDPITSRPRQALGCNDCPHLLLHRADELRFGGATGTLQNPIPKGCGHTKNKQVFVIVHSSTHPLLLQRPADVWRGNSAFACCCVGLKLLQPSRVTGTRQPQHLAGKQAEYDCPQSTPAI